MAGQIPKATLKAGLRLYHERCDLFANGGDYPYHPQVNCFSRVPHKLYQISNLWCYELTEDIPDVVHLSERFWWEDVQDHLRDKRGWDMVLAGTAITELQVSGQGYFRQRYLFSGVAGRPEIYASGQQRYPESRDTYPRNQPLLVFGLKASLPESVKGFRLRWNGIYFLMGSNPIGRSSSFFEFYSSTNKFS